MVFWTVRKEEVMRENCFHRARAMQEALLRECVREAHGAAD